MAELDRALDAVAESDQAHFVGRRDTTVVEAAEEALGVSLPPTYRRFVAELGAGSVGGREFYGVIDENFVDSSIPDGIWLTLDERTRFGLPKHLVIIGDSGMGEYYALDTTRRDSVGESPVVVWVAGASQEGDELEVIAQDFGSFFWSVLQQALGPHRLPAVDAGRAVDATGGDR
jgi:hypothetical protein